MTATVTVTATVEAANVPPRVRLDVSATGTPTVTATTVTRLDPDGSTVPVRTSDGNPLPLSAGIGLLYDYEAPFGAPVSFSTVESPSVVSARVTVPASQVWLIHPGVPALSVTVALLPGTLLEETRPAQQGVFYPMGRSTPVIITDGARKSASSALVVSTDSLDELTALRALVSDLGSLLLNIPTGMNTGFDTCYIAVQDIKVARLTDVVIDSYRTVTLPFVVVDRPVGGSQAERTLADVYADYATLADVRAAYTDLTDLLAGP